MRHPRVAMLAVLVAGLSVAQPASAALSMGAWIQHSPDDISGFATLSGEVTLGEVQRTVNKFLGQDLCHPTHPLANCPVADANNSGHVTIGEVQQAIARFLDGCPPPPP